MSDSTLLKTTMRYDYPGNKIDARPSRQQVRGRMHNGKAMVKKGMPRRCPIYVPYMPRIFKDMGYLWSMYGACPEHREVNQESTYGLPTSVQRGYGL
jgi:hypothetical protein